MRAVYASLSSLLLVAIPVGAQTWSQTSAPTNIPWSSVASSADGTKLAAVSSDGNVIETSSDSGSTWWPVTNYPIGSWFSIASSADGAKLAVAGFNSPICVSTNYGVDWKVTDSPRQGWFAIASSADGTKLVAAALIDASANPGQVFTSPDSGNTWTPTGLPNASWRAVASSADGTKLMAVCRADAGNNECPIFISTNSGTSWISNNLPVSSWNTAACSSDGTKLIAGDNFGNVCTSANSGSTWITNHLGVNPLLATSSADGCELLAVEDGGGVYVSTNYGAAWASANSPYEDWTAVAASADGAKIIAATFPAYDGGIFVSDSSLSPHLNFSRSNGSLNFSWLAPSTNLVLEASPDLMNWTPVTNSASLDLTNLEEQLTLSPTGGEGFFRLVSQ